MEETALLALLSNVAGDIVTLTKRDGSVYEGILDPDTVRPGNKFSTCTLSLVCQLSPQQRVLGQQKLTVAIKDVLQLQCHSFTSTVAVNAATGFQTDSHISSSLQHTGGKRELRPWVPDSEPSTVDLTLSSATSKPWDQFAANERLFGVRTDFDESAYTTSLNKGDPRFAERAAKADRLAKEINSAAKQTTNPHLIEERTGVLRDGEDEEDLYGAVLRDDGPPPGFSLPTEPDDDDDGVVTLPSQFEADREKISREFTALQEELAKDTVIEVPQSIKSKLNPTAETFVPSASPTDPVDPYYHHHQQQQQQQQQYQYYQPQQAYYYYDEYGNCYYYDPYQTQYY